MGTADVPTSRLSLRRLEMTMSADAHLSESRAIWYLWSSIALVGAVCAVMAILVDSRWLKPLWFVTLT